MGLARYFVVRRGNAWLVTLEGRAMAYCASRTEAIETAEVMADLMGAMHHDADVMAEMEDGAPLELVWCYGANAPPLDHKRGPVVADASAPHVKLVQRGDPALKPSHRADCG